MNHAHHPLRAAALLVLLAFAPAVLHAQTTPARAAEPVEKGTQVVSDSFRLNLEKKEGVFTGNVRVTDATFNLESEELVVYFTANNKMDRLVARGNVKIKQGADRAATCREAEYNVAEKRIRLTGEPVVMQNQNRVTGTVITIYPENDRMDVDGRSKVQFFLE
jgi:lipopolysaccharide export system protein LptA